MIYDDDENDDDDDDDDDDLMIMRMMMMMQWMVRRCVQKRCMRARSEAMPEDAFRSEALTHNFWLVVDLPL